MQTLRNTNDLNIKTATEEFDKNGRVLNPNFSVTPSKSLASMANLGVSSIITSPICYTDSENKDIQKVKNLVNKYKSNQLATHKYVEDTELHENLISGGSSPTKMMKDESIDIQCQIVKKNSDLEIPKQENLFKNKDIHKSINNSSKKQEESIFEVPFLQTRKDQSLLPEPNSDEELFLQFIKFKSKNQ